MPFPFYKQQDQMDCGPTCLRIVAKHYGRAYPLQRIREYSELNRSGISLLGISETAEKMGFRATGAKIGIAELKKATLPVILHWNQNHFVVLYRISSDIFSVADPAKGLISYNSKEFSSHWCSHRQNGSIYGVGLLLEPTPQFFKESGQEEKKVGFGTFISYLYSYKKLFVQLLLGMICGSVLQLLFPFLTQAIVDNGIGKKDVGFIIIILAAQFMLLISRTSVDFIRSWILLHITTRLNIAVVSDFIGKLMRLPISFFDTKMTGDIMQRIEDEKRIENFFASQSLTVVFSLFNLVLFSFVLAFYNLKIFIIILVALVAYTIWVISFLKRRKDLDFKRFEIMGRNQSTIVHLVNGMQEIKLNGCETQKRWGWERIQAKLFNYNVKNLALGQYQQAGATIINETKNIAILFIVSTAVINGEMTLGAMMAVQYIIGQINSPIEQFLSFVQSFQDAKISMERMNEIYELESEEPANKKFVNILPNDKTIHIQGLNFKYPGAGNELILKDINLVLPEGKTTAIVGMSGSGKTTLLKILLGFYKPLSGEILVGTSPLKDIRPSLWRRSCGIVMQEGHIFSDTIAANVAVADENPDTKGLWHALEAVNMQDFVHSLPLGLNTKIGQEGNGISAGQKQRILIARAIYKSPEYLLFDEATNALDANNERIISDHMELFFKNRTVVIVAHRLSTVKNADQIIVLRNGEIAETGTHETLSLHQGEYFELVKNQLALDE